MTPKEVAETAKICSMLAATLAVAKEMLANKQLILLSAAFVAEPTQTRYDDLTGYLINLGYQLETIRLRGVARRAFAAIPEFDEDNNLEESKRTYGEFADRALKAMN